jgi:hypothetical protein
MNLRMLVSASCKRCHTHGCRSAARHLGSSAMGDTYRTTMQDVSYCTVLHDGPLSKYHQHHQGHTLRSQVRGPGGPLAQGEIRHPGVSFASSLMQGWRHCCQHYLELLSSAHLCTAATQGPVSMRQPLRPHALTMWSPTVVGCGDTHAAHRKHHGTTLDEVHAY